MMEEIKNEAQQVLNSAEENIGGEINRALDKTSEAVEGIIAIEGLIQQILQKRQAVADAVVEVRRSLGLAQGYGLVANDGLGRLNGPGGGVLSSLATEIHALTHDLVNETDTIRASQELDDLIGRVQDLGIPLEQAKGELEDGRDRVEGIREEIVDAIEQGRENIARM